MRPTVELPPLNCSIPTSWEAAKRTAASAAGYHAISEWMTCPERSRLRSLGIVKTIDPWATGALNELDFGTLIHTLRAIRIVHGSGLMFSTLSAWRTEIGDEAYTRAAALMQVYDLTFPMPTEPFQYLGIEVEVYTNIGTEDAPIYRSVRYDTLVYGFTASGVRELYSFECKTSARSGEAVLLPYYPQGMTQMALWNANPALVAKYGQMRGVIFDLLVKTKTPNVDRIPRTFSLRQQDMILDYLRLPEPGGGAQYSVQADGSYPKMLHSCWGRWRPCEYIDLCHEGAIVAYGHRDGTPLTLETLHPTFKTFK